MINDERSVFVRPRVFYGGIAIAVALLVIDFLLLVRAHGSQQQIEIYTILFTLSILSVVYRYRSANPRLKRCGAVGLWILILILACTAGIFLLLAAAGQNRRPAAAPAGPADHSAPAAGEPAAEPEEQRDAALRD